MQILVVVANIQTRTLKTEGEKGGGVLGMDNKFNLEYYCVLWDL